MSTTFGILSQSDRSKELCVNLVRKQVSLTSPRTVKGAGNDIALNYLANGIKDMGAYRSAIRSQRDKQGRDAMPVVNFIENEENRTENITTYLNKLDCACLEMGNITNGGLTQLGLIGMLGDSDMMKRFNVGKRNAQIATCRQLLDSYKRMRLSGINIHWYAGDFQTATDLLRVGEMIKDYTGNELILGEVGMLKQSYAGTSQLLTMAQQLNAKFTVFYANVKSGASTGLYCENLRAWLDYMTPVR